MRILEKIIEGVPLVFPSVSAPRIPDRLRGFPDSCGPGAIGALFIPETPHGLRFSPACWSHDEFFRYSFPKLDSFYMANSSFRQNIQSLIDNSDLDSKSRALNEHIADLYFWAVAGPIGLSLFCNATGVKHKYNTWLKKLSYEVKIHG